MLLSIRITLDDDDTLLTFFNTYTKVLICKEAPDTECVATHYHILVHTELKQPTFRARMKVHFGKDLKGNSSYSMKAITDPEEDEKAVRYLCKGSKTQKPLIILNTYDIDAGKQYTAYWDVRKDIKYKTKTKPKDDCLEFIYTHYTDLCGPVTEASICDTMLQWYDEQGYPIPHRTTGQTIIKQSVYNLGSRVPQHKVIMYQYYGAS